MPAIQMARLKTQVDLLAQHFMQPAEFTRKLHAIFDLYAYRVYRPGQSVPPASLVPAYHIPRLVMIQLQSRLRPECLAHPAETLNLVDVLWVDQMLEPRLLAAYLLGQIPEDSAEMVIERLQRWSAAIEDRIIQRSLLDAGSVTLRQKASQKWLAVIQTWLSTHHEGEQATGLQALLPLIADPQFENLPAVFSTVSPLLQSAPPELQNDLQDILEACARRSPIETGFYLRQLLLMTNTPGLNRLARRIFTQLPPSSQANLRHILQAREA